MEEIFLSQSAALDVLPYTEKFKLAAAEQATITDACKAIVRLENLRLPHSDSGKNVVGHATAKVHANPTPETVAALADAIVRKEKASEISKGVSAALNPLVKEQIERLTPIACRAIDFVANSLRAAVASDQKLVAGAKFADTAAAGVALGNREARTIHELETLRGRVCRENAALHVLSVEWQLIPSPFEEPEAYSDAPDDDASLAKDFH